jgi:hypothetical protein
MRPYVAILVGLALGSVLLGACSGGGGKKTPAPAASPTEEGTPATGLNPADFQASVDNPFFPLSSLGLTVFEGQEPTDAGEVVQVRLETTVLPDTDVVAGIEVTVVEDKAFEDGELVESTLDYYAQHKDGAVYYLGERVDEYENGEVVSHTGQWLAGEGDNQPGIFMPAEPKLGDEFEQERAPGLAEDRSKVIAVDQSVTTPAGTFTGCIKTEDFDPLGNLTEFKYYCPNVGFVREDVEDGQIDLISY